VLIGYNASVSGLIVRTPLFLLGWASKSLTTGQLLEGFWDSVELQLLELQGGL
jgi:hypothetical protein